MDDKMIAALVALGGAILAALLNLYWNFRNAKALRKQPFLEKQLEFCLEATNVAATLATTADPEAFEAARSRFWELYWGPMAVVENEAVAGAMIDFGIALETLTGDGVPLPLESLQNQSIDLAAEVRKLILEAWSITSLEKVLHRNSSR